MSLQCVSDGSQAELACQHAADILTTAATAFVDRCQRRVSVCAFTCALLSVEHSGLSADVAPHNGVALGFHVGAMVTLDRL